MAQGFTLSVHTNVQAFIARLDDVQKKQVAFVTAYALTKTAQDIKAAEVDVMTKVFDRPTRFTLNALFVKPATKSTLKASVEFKEGFGSIPAWRYLGPQVVGGGRKHKSHEKRLIEAGLMLGSEYAVPGRAIKLDAYGNIPGSILTRILSDLGAQADKWQNTTVKSRGRRRNSKRGRYMVLRGQGIPPGVYHRTGPRQVMPVIMFVRAPNYERRYPYYETARRIMQRNFARHFHQGWDRYVTKTVRRIAA